MSIELDLPVGLPDQCTETHIVHGETLRCSKRLHLYGLHVALPFQKTPIADILTVELKWWTDQGVRATNDEIRAELDSCKGVSGTPPGQTTTTAPPVRNPTDTAPNPVRDVDTARTMGFTGGSCSVCGSLKMARTGKCETCIDCGNAGGCG